MKWLQLQSLRSPSHSFSARKLEPLAPGNAHAPAAGLKGPVNEVSRASMGVSRELLIETSKDITMSLTKCWWNPPSDVQQRFHFVETVQSETARFLRNTREKGTAECAAIQNDSWRMALNGCFPHACSLIHVSRGVSNHSNPKREFVTQLVKFKSLSKS